MTPAAGSVGRATGPFGAGREGLVRPAAIPGTIEPWRDAAGAAGASPTINLGVAGLSR